MGNGRAAKGGEIGTNGEFYEGGKFLPSTTLPKGTPKPARKPAARREEIARREYALPPEEGLRAIYGAIAGIFAQVRDGTMIITASDTTLAYYKRERAAMEALAARWNAGERWVRQDEAYR